jgi:aspartate carbamoyltransferase regulatory subunit
MNILLGDLNVKVCREDIFKPTIGNESLHEIIRVVNFATSKNCIVKGTMLPHRNINKFTWISPDGKTHNQIGHMLIDSRRYSSILDVRSFRVVDCDTDHCLAVSEVRERLAVSKQTRQSLKILNEAENKEQYWVETGSQLWKTWALRWVLIELEKLLERISTFQLKRACIIMN